MMMKNNNNNNKERKRHFVNINFRKTQKQNDNKCEIHTQNTVLYL